MTSIIGTFTGYAGLGQFAEGLRNTFDTQPFHVDDVVGDATLAAAFGRFEHRVRANGRMFRSRWAVMCRFQDGKAALFRFFEDTAALEEAPECRTVCQESIA